MLRVHIHQPKHSVEEFVTRQGLVHQAGVIRWPAPAGVVWVALRIMWLSMMTPNFCMIQDAAAALKGAMI
ncbi:MAG: hypothetical protein HoeaKO_01500 [Hoeflea alexandrii]